MPENEYARIRFSLKVPVKRPLAVAVTATEEIQSMAHRVINSDVEYDGMLFQIDGLDGDG